MTVSRRFSLEFFPPKTEAGAEKLMTTKDELEKLNPDFCSLTYGAGGSTRDATQGIAMAMKASGTDIAPHLSFGGDGEDSVLALINSYKDAGINRIVALRGDLPSGMGGVRPVHANELVAFIRQHTGDYFNLEVAAYPEIHPEANSYSEDIGYLKQKLDAGANSAITQYFYNIDAYFYFLDACAKQGIDKPIYPGIMPITNFKNLARFSANCGAEIPQWLARRLSEYGDDIESITSFSTDFVTELCDNLLAAGAPGIHFYTMNAVQPIKRIWHNLDI